jgi:polycomb protein EED
MEKNGLGEGHEYGHRHDRNTQWDLDTVMDRDSNRVMNRDTGTYTDMDTDRDMDRDTDRDTDRNTNRYTDMVNEYFRFQQFHTKTGNYGTNISSVWEITAKNDLKNHIFLRDCHTAKFFAEFVKPLQQFSDNCQTKKSLAEIEHCIGTQHIFIITFNGLTISAKNSGVSIATRGVI